MALFDDEEKLMAVHDGQEQETEGQDPIDQEEWKYLGLIIFSLHAAIRLSRLVLWNYRYGSECRHLPCDEYTGGWKLLGFKKALVVLVRDHFHPDSRMCHWLSSESFGCPVGVPRPPRDGRRSIEPRMTGAPGRSQLTLDSVRYITNTIRSFTFAFQFSSIADSGTAFVAI